MKRVVLLLLAALLVGNADARTDVADLIPVEVIRLRTDGSLVYLETDVAGSGIGYNMKAAVDDLKQKASGEVFMDTAEYLLVAPDALNLIPHLQDIIRPSCKLCVEIGKVDIKQVAAYLKTHDPETALLQYLTRDQMLPRIIQEGDEMRLVQSP